MTQKYELTKKYHRKDLVTVCLTCYENYLCGLSDEMFHRIGDEEWLSYKPPVKDYPNYSQGMCLEHYKVYLVGRVAQLHRRGVEDKDNIFWLRLLEVLNGVVKY